MNDGLPYRIVGVCQSIQDHKTIEENLRAARDKAQESDRLKSAFLANMSHEIRTPFNAILGFSNLLTNEGMQFGEAEKKEYGRLITANGEQLLRLITDILDLSKLESNTLEFEFETYPLNVLLSDIYLTQQMHMPPGVAFELDVPETDVKIETDSTRLKHLLNNLINNAVKFTERGSITFGFRLCGDGRNVELFVRDTGRGIPAEYGEKIFERFYKVDTFVKGVGLGLSISRTIAQRLGGSISMASREGGGTCFTLLHPLRGKVTA